MDGRVKANHRKAEESVEESNVTKESSLGIKGYSETSSANENSDTGEEKESSSSSRTAASESIEESQQDQPKPRTAADEEYERDFAQQKKNRRARAQPGAKRGGRRDTRRGGWGGLLGRKKAQFEAGDLVEAEWWETGWWYVGYIQGEPEGQEESSTTGSGAAAKSGARRKNAGGVFHVVFADGDEADVLGKNLKRVGTTGEHGKHRNSRSSNDRVCFLTAGKILPTASSSHRWKSFMPRTCALNVF